LHKQTNSKQFWYQFFQCTDAGADAVRCDPVGWVDEKDFQAVSDSFKSPDWAEITLDAHRSRYLASEVVDHSYYGLQQRLQSTVQIQTPALMIQGASDSCDLPSGSEGQERYFLNGYSRILLSGIGHFPHQEALMK
jgi:pimeloyl-ACP methyl ester carboxylesterase